MSDNSRVIVRYAAIADAAEIGAVHVRSWQHAYRGHLDQDFLDALDPVARAEGWRRILEAPAVARSGTLVAQAADHIVGFAHVGASRDPDADTSSTGELVAIYVLPTEWSKGFGSQLMTAALTKLRSDEFQVATLWVLDGNHAAMGFYESTGWIQDGSIKTAEIGGRPVSELRFRRAV